MRIVVTGASGFIAGALTHLLRTMDGVAVTAVSRRATSGIVRVQSYADTPGGDVLVHLAEENDRARVADAPERYLRQAAETLAALGRKGFGRVVYVSSGVVYGDRDQHAHDVGDPVVVCDGYGELKRRNELTVLDWTGGVVARLSNVYGPAMPETNVVSTVLRQISARGPVHVRDTRPVRDYLWIDDAARGLAAISGGATSGVFNLSTGVGTSVGVVARTALEEAGAADREVIGENVGAVASTMILNPARTAEVFAWRPDLSLTEGLSRLVRHQAQRA